MLGGQGASSNASSCVVLPGAWQGHTRYRVQLRASIAPGTDDSALSVPAPSLWASFMSGRLPEAASEAPALRITGTDKFGAICRAPGTRAQALSTAFNACRLAEALGLPSQAARAPSACLNVIRQQAPAAQVAAARAAGVAGLLQAPPIMRVDALEGVPPESCGLQQAFSRALGGQCIECYPGSVTTDSDGARRRRPHTWGQSRSAA